MSFFFTCSLKIGINKRPTVSQAAYSVNQNKKAPVLGGP
jgi:hypothetical protein